ncbi:hypothetical protein [Fontibacillus sp. BL9]|uniref:hypothetical protein n=1 Tax=Fontibacillus sp. BL9 TaxID=3389971 RepID=UPI00397AAFD4
MFKSTAQFEACLVKVLVSILNEEPDANKWCPGISDIELNDVIAQALLSGFITGVQPQLTGDQLHLVVSYPRLTYNGLQFLEKLGK